MHFSAASSGGLPLDAALSDMSRKSRCRANCYVQIENLNEAWTTNLSELYSPPVVGYGKAMMCLLAVRLAPRMATHLVLVFALHSRAAYTTPTQAEDKLSDRIAKIDDRLTKAFEGLARKYDELQDPEAAHFLASCAVGLGSKDQKVAGIKASREVDVFLARLRGGEALADANPIDTALRGLEAEYRKILESLLPQLKRRELSAAARKLLLDLVPKCEIARGAEEYIQALQRFNKLSKAMQLRGILWDFEFLQAYPGLLVHGGNGRLSS
jgi:hypothetical protein